MKERKSNDKIKSYLGFSAWDFFTDMLSKGHQILTGKLLMNFSTRSPSLQIAQNKTWVGGGDGKWLGVPYQLSQFAKWVSRSWRISLKMREGWEGGMAVCSPEAIILLTFGQKESASEFHARPAQYQCLPIQAKLNNSSLGTVSFKERKRRGLGR